MVRTKGDRGSKTDRSRPRSVLINVRSLSGLPRKKKCGDAQVGVVGAVSIGSFELSRWRGGRGGLWDFNPSVLVAGCL